MRTDKTKTKKGIHGVAGKKGGAVFLAGVLLCLLVGVGLACVLHSRAAATARVRQYEQKAGLLKAEALQNQALREYGLNPAGNTACYAVFISVCDTNRRASVFTGTGSGAFAAWRAANEKAAAAVQSQGLQPVWVKADVVCFSQEVTMQQLAGLVKATRPEYFHYGIAFDPQFETALLEAELNGAKIYDYDTAHPAGIDLQYLNNYLTGCGRQPLEQLPGSCIVFQCRGWFCDEQNQVWALASGGLDHGRRQVSAIDAAYAKQLICSASDFLIAQVRQNGSFTYGYYPRFGNEIQNYNIVRHASTIWSLLCRYRIEPSEQLKEVIDKTIKYLLGQMVYRNDSTAYIYEAKAGEYKLGANGVALIALTEYMDIFQNTQYIDQCRALGNGILTMLDMATGEYVHVLDENFLVKEAYRTVYYDGEATFAMCRLYGLTGEQVWLDAACAAVEHFIAADYTRYRDHWVAYAMNEITRYVTDEPAYYAFALQNAQSNLEAIYNRDTTYHTYLELLMATFELYDRLLQSGAQVTGLDCDMLLQTIYCRAQRMLNGYFYPEVAMYMQQPSQILNTFMVRHDGYRVRIDDVQHNIGGYYLYYKNYQKLVEYGMLRVQS